MTDVTWLPRRTNDVLERTVAALGLALGERLLAAVLVGNAVNPARFDRGREPEVLAVVASAADIDLVAVSSELAGPMRAGARVRLVSRRELERSCDVFALEIADWKARHILLAGEDPFTGLAVTPEHLRHGIEVELRGLARRTRNRLLAGLATHDRRDDVHAAILAGYDRFLVASYHALSLLGEVPPVEEPAIVKRIAERLKAPADPFLSHLALLRHGESREDPIAGHHALLGLLSPLIDLIDDHPVGS